MTSVLYDMTTTGRKISHWACDCCCSDAKLCLTLCNPMDCSTSDFPVLHYLQSLLKFMTIELVMPPTTSSSVAPFSSCPQSFPSSGSFLMSWLFASSGQSIGASASTSILPMYIQGWSPFGLTGLWLSLIFFLFLHGNKGDFYSNCMNILVKMYKYAQFFWSKLLLDILQLTAILLFTYASLMFQTLNCWLGEMPLIFICLFSLWFLYSWTH